VKGGGWWYTMVKCVSLSESGGIYVDRFISA
jgi:hypothetical protein